MYQISLVVLSILLFVTGIVVTIYTVKKKHGFTNRVIARLIIFVGSSLFPLYLIGNSGATGGLFDAVVSSFLGIVRVVTGENSLGDTRDAIGSMSAGMTIFIANYTALIHLILALLVLGFVLNFFKNYLSKFSYRFIERGKLCVFTEVSQRSLLLCEDIRSKEKESSSPSCIFVFLRKDRENVQQNDGDDERLNKLGAHVFDFDVCDLPIYKRYLKHSVCFFLLKLNEEENLKQALALSQKYGKSSFAGHMHIHVMNTSPEAAIVLDTIEYSSVLSLRIFNETRALLYHLFDENPLFLARRENRLKILVVGAGRVGTEAVKLAAWCGQTVQLRPEIVVVDYDVDWDTRFALECPDLAPKTCPDDAKKEANIRFYAEDVRGDGFANVLKAHPDTGYVICALGNEELNLRTAIAIRGAYEEIRFENAKDGEAIEKPQIHVLLANPFLADIGKKLLVNAKVPCDLKPFGSLSELYSWESVASPYYDHLGMAVNRFYARHYAGTTDAAKLAEIEKEADKQYEDKEYNRSSSMALGLHSKYKLYSALCEIGGRVFSKEAWRKKPSDEMINALGICLQDKDVVESLSVLEHRRWNCYMRGEGWRRADFSLADSWFGVEKNDHRNFISKQTACLVSWEELLQVDKWLLEKHGKNSDMQELDRVMVRESDVILRQAKEIHGYSF